MLSIPTSERFESGTQSIDIYVYTNGEQVNRSLYYPVPEIGGEHREDGNHDISEARGLGKKKIL